MKRSFARSLTLLSLTCLTLVGFVPGATAAPLPDDFFVEKIHGEFAWGRFGTGLGSSDSSKRLARVNLRSGAQHEFLAPAESSYFLFGPSSDTSLTGIRYSGGYFDHGEQLVRYDVDGGYQVLDSLPSGPIKCPSDIYPLSIESDGGVIALTRAFIDVSPPGDYKCALDPARSHLKRYSRTGASEEVWIPQKYRPWLLEYNITANGNTFAIARTATHRRPGVVVVLDTARQKVLGKHRVGRNPGLMFGNPHSLYIFQDSHRADGKVVHWQVGRRAPRVVFRGKLTMAGVCGNRALVIRERTMLLLTSKGKTVLTRRTARGHYFARTVCSGNYLHYLKVLADDDYYGNSPFTRHLADISTLPR